MIEVLKASAGSGKTFTLARRYIMLLLETEDRYAYRHILAVTFTNKATEEMKSRILKELYILSTEPHKSDYHDDFVPDHYASDQLLKDAAERVLCNILHDYGAFAVSTIDRFFQQTLKAFSKEIGQFSSYQVELDRESLIAESVDRVLDSVTGDAKDRKKLKWLTDNTISKIENGEGYKLDFTLMGVASRLKSEEHRALVESEGLDENQLYSEESLQKLSQGCDKVCMDYVAQVKAAADNLKAAFTSAAIDPYDTSAHFMDNNINKYSSLAADAFVPCITESFRDKALKSGKWFPKAKAHLADRVDDRLMRAAAAFVALFDDEYKVYNTALLLKGQVYGFGIANELHNEFEALLKEKNVLSLDDSNTILRNIIDGTETPFIYEKLGVRYEHFLLDEFQDTSRVQWENFRPLLKNSIDSGFYNLIVGDVKQSIYRFRNSDWKLLRDEVVENFGSLAKEDVLDANWRSRGNIVKFNNSFFAEAARMLDEKYGFPEDKGVISSIYSDVHQEIAKDEGGAVDVTFCSSEDELQVILDSINEALEQGYSYKDIAVLVRWNREGSEIASFLISNKIRVVTDDSLQISSSLTVRRLVALLSSIDNPDDSMSKYLAERLEADVPDSYSSVVDLCESLLRSLRAYDEQLFDTEVLYVQSFMDLVREFTMTEGNNLHSFLKNWEGNTQSISSPSVGDAVRIMTVHKSKGLDFPYVIVPYLERVGLSRTERKWCRPDVSGTALEDVAEGIYDVNLSSRSDMTLFASQYKDEVLMQYVDNINVVYVAMTRAKEMMHIVAAMPEGDGDFSYILHTYLGGKGKELGFGIVSESPLRYRFGSALSGKKKQEDNDMKPFPATFCSWPLNLDDDGKEGDVVERGRLRFSPDAYDFFAQDGATGVAASSRIKGIVLHDILAGVCAPDDLGKAVASAVSAGYLSQDEAAEAASLLGSRIDAVKHSGWFPEDGSQILNETAVMDSDGRIYRPDRVVVTGNRVKIVDYKFGEHRRGYETQLRKYAEIWTRMGYEVDSACLWYVLSGEVRTVVGK